MTQQTATDIVNAVMTTTDARELFRAADSLRRKGCKVKQFTGGRVIGAERRAAFARLAPMLRASILIARGPAGDKLGRTTIADRAEARAELAEYNIAYTL